MICIDCNQSMNRAGQTKAGTQLFRCMNPECSLFGKKTTGKDRPGRPRKYSTNADRQKAYRNRIQQKGDDIRNGHDQ